VGRLIGIASSASLTHSAAVSRLIASVSCFDGAGAIPRQRAAYRAYSLCLLSFGTTTIQLAPRWQPSVERVAAASLVKIE
jgi:hypothetical protein